MAGRVGAGGQRGAITLVAAILASACSVERQDEQPTSNSPAQEMLPALPEPVLPGPTLSQPLGVRGLAADAEEVASRLGQVEDCAVCHSEVVRQQGQSAHAFASFNNPIYRRAVDELRREAGDDATLVCAACHDPALLLSGAMESEVAESDPLAVAALRCRLCHGVESGALDGNGSYQLRVADISIPSSRQGAGVQAHRDSARIVDAESLCGSCHQAFLTPLTGNGHFVNGQTELRAWKESAYQAQGAQRVDPGATTKSCVDCHMARRVALSDDAATDEEGKITSHLSVGAHTWLGAMLGSDEHEEATRERLKGIATLRAVLVPQPEGPAVDLVIRNTGVGHRFPGGVRDATRTWLSVELLDEVGEVIAESSMKDPEEVHRLQSLVVDGEGAILEGRQTHRFHSSVADHSIAPRAAVVVRYELAEELLSRGVKLRARLLHQSRSGEVQRLSCEDSKSQRAQAFARLVASVEQVVLDPCVAQPVTELAAVEVDLLAPATPDAQSYYEHGMAWLSARQEEADTARDSLMRALKGFASAAPVERAKVLAALGRLEGRLGRTEEATDRLDQARALIGAHPAIATALGDALARVWRWGEAADAYAEASTLVPANSSVWRRLSVARASDGQYLEALEAAQKGLALEPRDADMLRVQALALEELGAESEVVERAMAAYLDFRPADDRSRVRMLCVQKSERCAREQTLVHSHRLEPRP